MINNSDVMYKDDKVCVLKPSVKKGILIFSEYKNPKNIKGGLDHCGNTCHFRHGFDLHPPLIKTYK